MNAVKLGEVRLATKDDTMSVHQFSCARHGCWYEHEVEEFVQHELLDQFYREEIEQIDPRLWLVHDQQGRLIGITGHEITDFGTPQGEIEGTRLVVVAASLDVRGAYVQDEESRLSDYLMRLAMSDALDRRRTRAFTAVVARENSLSLAMCARNGLDVQRDTRNPDYVRVLGILP